MKNHSEEGQFNELGFLFFDLIHITTAIIILAILFVTQSKEIVTNQVLKGEFAIECINQFSEIVLGALLMSFVFFICKNSEVKTERIAYSFALIIASIALLIPSISNIIDIILYSGGNMILAIFQIAFPLFAVMIFIIALLRSKENLQAWAKMLLIGMACMLLSSASDIAEVVITLVNGKDSAPISTVKLFALLAPLFPVALGVKDLKRMGFID